MSNDIGTHVEVVAHVMNQLTQEHKNIRISTICLRREKELYK